MFGCIRGKYSWDMQLFSVNDDLRHVCKFTQESVLTKKPWILGTEAAKIGWSEPAEFLRMNLSSGHLKSGRFLHKFPLYRRSKKQRHVHATIPQAQLGEI